MASVSFYLTFNGKAEEAFNLYKKVFGTEFAGPVIRYKSTWPKDAPALAEADQDKIAHIALPLPGGTQIMATDMLESMGQKVTEGTNFSINLALDDCEEADRLYKELSEGGDAGVVPHEEFWGYGGRCRDRFGVGWMFNIIKKQW